MATDYTDNDIANDKEFNKYDIVVNAGYDRDNNEVRSIKMDENAFIETKDSGGSINIARGNVIGVEIWSAIGERESMGTTATGEDIWRGNELTPAPTSTTSIPTPDSAGEQMTVVSEDANDTLLGTGVRTLRIHYLDASGVEQTEDIEMDGITEVDTVATDIRFVNDMYTLTKGTNGAAEGHIKIYKKGNAGLVYNMIALGGNKSMVPNRMIPVGKEFVLKGWHAEEAQGKRCACRIRSTDMYGELIDGVFCFKDVAYLNKTTSAQIDMNIVIPALSIMKVSGWADAIGAEVSCGWWGELYTL